MTKLEKLKHKKVYVLYWFLKFLFFYDDDSIADGMIRNPHSIFSKNRTVHSSLNTDTTLVADVFVWGIYKVWVIATPKQNSKDFPPSLQVELLSQFIRIYIG